MKQRFRELLHQVIFAQSLRAKLLIILFAIFLLMLVAMGTSIYIFTYRSDTGAWHDLQGNAARVAATKVADILTNAHTILSVGFVSGNDHQHIADQIASVTPSFLEIVRLDTNGNLLGVKSSDQPFLADTSTIQQAQWFQEARAGRTYYGIVQVHAQQAPYVIVSLPLPDGGIAAGRISLTVLKDAVSSVHFGATGKVYLFNRQGLIITHTDDQAALDFANIAGRPEFNEVVQSADPEWYGEFTDIQNKPVVGVSTKVPGADWYVLTETTSEETYLNSQHIWRVIGGNLLFAIAAMFILSRLMFRYLFRAIKQLEDGVRAISDGNLGYRIDMNRADEIGVVATAFDTMAVRLGEQRKALEQRTTEIQALYQTSIAINAQLDLSTLLLGIIQRASSLLDAPMSGLYLLEPDGTNLKLYVTHNMPDDFNGIVLHSGEGVVGQVALQAEPVMVADYQNWYNKAEAFTNSSIRRVLGVPIKGHNKVIGVIMIADDVETGCYTEDEVRVVALFADHAAIAIEHTRLYESVQHELSERKLAEAAVRKSEERFRTILDSVNDAIYVYDPENGVVLDANDKMRDMFGDVRDANSRNPIIEAVPVDSQFGQVGAGEIAKQTDGQSPQFFEWKTKDKTGREFWSEVNVRPATIDDRDAVLVVIRDIDERIRAAQIQKATYRISELAQTTRTLDELYSSIHTVISGLMPARNMYIALYDAAEDLFHFPYFYDEYETDPSPMQPGKSLTNYVFQTKKPLLASAELFDQLIDSGQVELVGEHSLDWLGVPLITPQGKIIGVLVIQTYDEKVRLGENDKVILSYVSVQITTVIERMRVEKALQESEQLYRSLVTAMPDGIALMDLKGLISYASPQMITILGAQNSKAVTGTCLYDWIVPACHAKVWSNFEKGFKGEATTDDEYELIRADGSHFFGDIIGVFLRDEHGTPAGLVAITRDITEQKQADFALSESERRYRMIADNSSDIIWVRDMNLKPTYISPSDMRVRGYTQEEGMAQTLPEVLTPESMEVAMQTFATAINNAHNWSPERLMGESLTMEVETYCKDGSTIWVDVVMTFILDDDGKPVEILGVTRDITERRQAQAALQKMNAELEQRVSERTVELKHLNTQLVTENEEKSKLYLQVRTSLKEKETLLKEIHHRVKNNLQVISSLLSLQSAHIKDQPTRQLFRDSQNRVKSMALIHEKLYQSQDLARIDFKEYVQSLSSYLVRSFAAESRGVNFRIDVESIALSIDQAIPCGLIINELVSNSLKYAFPNGQKGEVYIQFKLAADHKYHMEVGDDGKGFPAHVDFRNTTSLGLQLVNSLVSQLEGTVELVVANGTEFRIAFGVPEGDMESDLRTKQMAFV